jgi:hypothetical protein
VFDWYLAEVRASGAVPPSFELEEDGEPPHSIDE